MSAITLRSVKGADLTPSEVDQNFTNLNDDKLEKGAYNANHTMLMKDADGNITPIVVAEGALVGRLAGGLIKALSLAEVKAWLGWDTKADISINAGRGVLDSGEAVLADGEAVVLSDALVTGNEKVRIWHQVDGGTPGWQRVSNKEAGTFTITSSNALDTSTVFWEVYALLDGSE